VRHVDSSSLGSSLSSHRQSYVGLVCGSGFFDLTINKFLVFHRTDTHIQVFTLPLPLLIQS
jgi:hypothetical protein